mmetsp:Transcript_13476/g.40731  ORF Transcript_13476/g.40731 Transcript_13476/m.40731 type:complete len:103 (-) Transcript_13476:161-469(-)
MIRICSSSKSAAPTRAPTNRPPATPSKPSSPTTFLCLVLFFSARSKKERSPSSFVCLNQVRDGQAAFVVSFLCVHPTALFFASLFVGLLPLLASSRRTNGVS